MVLKDKVVVVTGSTRGIGRAITEAAAQEGAKVIINSRNESAVIKTVEEFKKQGFKASGVRVDVSNKDDLEKLLKHAVDTYGRVDIWVNSAGLSGGYKPLGEISGQEIQNIVDVNLTAVLKASRMIISYFQKQGGGILINVPGKGYKGGASPYTTVYAATKAGVASLTKSLAKENRGTGISINGVVPGMVRTDFFKDLKVSPQLENNMKVMPYLLNALAVEPGEAGRGFIPVMAQEPGKVTGKIYSLFKGWRRIRGISLMAYCGMTGKLKGAR